MNSKANCLQLLIDNYAFNAGVHSVGDKKRMKSKTVLMQKYITVGWKTYNMHEERIDVKIS